MITNFTLFTYWVKNLEVRVRSVVNLLEYNVCFSRFKNLVFTSFVYLHT